MTHDKDCSAMTPCQTCSKDIGNAIYARQEYNRALEILEELGAMPWILRSAHNTSDEFWRVYENLRDLRDHADRLIPKYDY
jgi:hypothetical protein